MKDDLRVGDKARWKLNMGQDSNGAHLTKGKIYEIKSVVGDSGASVVECNLGRLCICTTHSGFWGAEFFEKVADAQLPITDEEMKSAQSLPNYDSLDQLFKA